MADGKGGSFTKVVQKHAGRAKERILQNLGRADKTKDEVFEVYLYNFTRQQTAAAKLQKEFKNYVLCIKSLQLASKALMDTLSEIYEQEWVGHEQIPVKAQTLELLWDDYHRKMNDQVMIPLNSYITQFADVRGRIAKRGRKLVDYDKCRHSVESLRNSAKKKDDYKLGKAREELEEAKQMYEVINNELHEELPALYENRIPFLVSNLQTFFTAESTFHAENAKVFSFLVDTMQKLAVESEHQGTTIGPYPLPNPPRRYSPNRRAPPLRRTHSNRERTTANANEMSVNSVVAPNPPVRLAGDCRDTTVQYARVRRHSAHGRPLEKNRRGASFLSLSAATESGRGGRPVELYLVVRPPKGAAEPRSEPSSVSKEADTRPYEEIEFKKAARLENEDSALVNSPGYRTTTGDRNGEAPPRRDEKDYEPVDVGAQMNSDGDRQVGDELYDIPVGATTTDLPAGVLYRVRATYKYTAEDVDELNFESGEIIRVIEYDDPEEQEEGWLMGIKESTGEKGLFPANFTRPI
ncbi:amphiphysin-like isoform X6 [Dermacentor silvarum]|uniref:amphiphysin-like isoform X6 n=1 Tax=Dermacentor silvarum TaxID=543639 RepID=UPI00189950D1|nr:amphiphysin-like isoform X6 [Dermacentor silvarum]